MSYNLCKTGPQIDEVLQGYSAVVAAANTATAKASEASTYASNAAASASNASQAEQTLESAIVKNPGSTVIDKTLTITGAAADSKTIGDKITSLNGDLVRLTNDNNILDNGFFQVNSRGAGSYQAPSDGVWYLGTVDRWRVRNAKVTKTNNGITLTTAMSSQLSGICQYIDRSTFENELVGAEITASILFTDETLGYAHIDSLSANGGEFTLTNGKGMKVVFTPWYSSEYPSRIDFRYGAGTSATDLGIVAVKVEKGSHSTLSSLNKPMVTDELLRCITSTADSTDLYANKIIVEPLVVSNGGESIGAGATKTFSLPYAPKPSVAFLSISGKGAFGVYCYLGTIWGYAKADSTAPQWTYLNQINCVGLSVSVSNSSTASTLSITNNTSYSLPAIIRLFPLA